MAAENPTKRSRTRENNNNWKGGRSRTSHGYILIRVGVGHPLADVRGYAYEHRLKAWLLGHDIEGKHVHHDDHVKHNNANSNLEPLTPAEHRAQHRKPGSNKRLPYEKNPIVFCGCGCGAEFFRYDTSNRPRKYVPGHNPQSRPTVDALLADLDGSPKTRSELILSTGLTTRAVAVALSKLRRKGVVRPVRRGVWERIFNAN